MANGSPSLSIIVKVSTSITIYIHSCLSAPAHPLLRVPPYYVRLLLLALRVLNSPASRVCEAGGDFTVLVDAGHCTPLTWCSIYECGTI